MRILHLSFHNGCHRELSYVMKQLGHQLTTVSFDDGTRGKYNVGQERADRYWEKHREFLETFDAVITSDTAPISRVFMREEWTKPLIIWVNNRFDYADQATNDCNFPDEGYYVAFREALKQPNVIAFGYTEFEREYCLRKDVTISDFTIKPTGQTLQRIAEPERNGLVFVGSYHNDNIMMSLSKKLNELGIESFNGRYNGLADLMRYKAVVHIPYAWSNYALFENLQHGIVTMVPTERFFLELKKDKDFFWSPPYSDDDLSLSEWYNGELPLLYFDSWMHLKHLLDVTNLEKHRETMLKWGEEHTKRQLELWRNIFPCI